MTTRLVKSLPADCLQPAIGRRYNPCSDMELYASLRTKIPARLRSRHDAYVKDLVDFRCAGIDPFQQQIFLDRHETILAEPIYQETLGAVRQGVGVVSNETGRVRPRRLIS